jgi:hypothetical protein
VVDTLESLGLDEALKTMQTMHDPQLTQQCQHYEHEVRKEDAAVQSDDSDPQLVKMRVNGKMSSPQNGVVSPAVNGLNGMADRRMIMRKRQQVRVTQGSRKVVIFYREEFFAG